MQKDFKMVFTYELDGKKIAFHRGNMIEVQVGKGKGKYETKHSFTAPDFAKAVFYFNGINVGNGYKKRLICHSLNKPVLAKVLT